MKRQRRDLGGRLAARRRVPGLAILAFAGLCLATACTTGGGGSHGTPTVLNTAVIATAQFQGSGSIATISLTPPFETAVNLEPTSSDNWLRVSAGLVYVVNRFGFDNIQILDPNRGFSTIAQWSVGNGSNPTDVLVLAARVGFVTRESVSASDLFVLDLADGSDLGHIDMLPYADTAADPTVAPRPIRVDPVGNVMYVLLQNIDPTYSIYGRGAIVQVNPFNSSVLGATFLHLSDPYGESVFGTKIYIAMADGFGFASSSAGGGIEVYDTLSNTSSVLVDDAELGGFVGGVEVVSADKGYATVFDPVTFGNHVKPFSPRTGAVGGEVYGCAGNIPDVRSNGNGLLLIACQEVTRPGIAILDTTTDTILADRIGTGLPPNAIGFLP